MASSYPFLVYKRASSPYFYVKFHLQDGSSNYTQPKSTKCTTKADAIKTALQWLSTGEAFQTIQKQTIKNIINENTSREDLEYLLKLLQDKGLISAATITGSKTDIDLVEYVRDFWTWEKSPYIKEKLSRGQSIHKTHVAGMLMNFNKHLASRCEGLKIGTVTRQFVVDCFDFVAGMELAPHTKNVIMRSLTTPLKFAYSRNLISTDITAGIMFFSGNSKERDILTPEIAKALFSSDWKDREREKLANLVSMLTGMRSGEIRALRLCDLGENCIYIRHSYSDKEGLKCTKNGEERIVQFPFPAVIEALKQLYWTNPFTCGKIDKYIFYASIPGKPIEASYLCIALHEELEKIGITDAKKYAFHAWRHFYTTYMSDRVSNKHLLQLQTGHKTMAMLEHYADHTNSEQLEAIESASRDAFSALLPDNLI